MGLLAVFKDACLSAYRGGGGDMVLCNMSTWVEPVLLVSSVLLEEGSNVLLLG